jgi:hypothetical protein
MIIGVNLTFITTEEQKQIILFYNNKKNKDDNQLEILHRFELGFEIKLNKPINCMMFKGDVNNHIKQLRFKNKELTSGFYNDFTIDEKFLLYRSLCHVLGCNNVYIKGLTEFDKKQLLVEIKNDNTDEFNKGIDTDTEIESF